MAIKDSIVNLIIKGKDLLSPAAQSATDSVDKLQERSESLSRALAKLTQTQRNIEDFQRLRQETDSLKRNWQEAESEVARLSAALSNAERPTKSMARELQKAERAAEEAKTAWVRNREALDRLSPRLKAAGVDLNNLDRAQDDLEQSSRRLRSDLTAVNTQLQRQQQRARESGDAMRTAGAGADGLAGHLKRAAQQMVAFVAAAAGLHKIKETFLSILQTGDQFEKLDQQLAQVFGSVEKGRAASEWIQQFASHTPLQLEEVTQAFVRLKNFGIDPTNGTLQALVDQNEAMGGSFQDLEGLVNAVGQAWAKGKLQGEEILQLIERGVPVWELLAQATGKTVVQLQEMSSAGELGRDTIAALVQEMGKASEGAASQSMGRLSGLVSNLKDQWDQFLNLIAQSGALDYVKEQLQALLDKIIELRTDGTLDEWAKRISDGIISVGQAIRGTISAVAQYKDELILLAKAFAAIKVASAIKGLAAWTAALRASRAEMMAAGAEAVGSTRRLAAFGKRLAAFGKVLRGLAGPVMITIGAVIKGLDAVSRNLRGVEDAERRLALQQKELELQQLREINQLKQKASAFEEYASVARHTASEIAAMSQKQRQAYADQLAGAKKYYEYAIDALQRQAAMGEDVAGELAAMRGELDRVNQSLQTVSAESIRAGEALRLGITKAALDALTAFTQLRAEGVSTADALQQSFDALDLKTPEGITSMAQALGSLVRTAQVSGQDIKDALTKPLEDVSEDGLSRLQREFSVALGEITDDTRGAGQVMDSVLGEAFSRLGADLTKAQTGITQTGKTAIDAFGVVVENIQLAGRSATENAAILKEAFTSAVQKVSTEKGLNLLEQQLKAAAGQGVDVSDALLQVRERLREIRRLQQDGESDIAKPLKDTSAAATDAENKIRNMASTIGDTSKEAAEFREKWEAAWGGAFGQALTNAREKVTALSTAARNLFEMKIGGNAFVNEAESASEALDRARQRTDELARARRSLMSSSLSAWFADTALAAAEVEEKFWSQAVAMENLQRRIESGAYSLDQLNQLSTTAARKFDLLDSQRLSNLQSAIDAARSKLESLSDSADSTLNSLRQRLAEIRGDTEEAQRLEYEAERERLLEQLEAAQKAGAREAVADYREALKTLEQIYKIEQKNRTEEANAREKEAADRAREQQLAELERQRAQSAASTTVRTTTPQPTQTIILRGPTGSQTSVQTSDPDALLKILEESGLRSA